MNALSLELFVENGWEIPVGYLEGQEADPMNYTYTEYQEAKRGAHNPKILKAQIKACWQSSDSRQSFETALERKGLFLAQGDRRGFVAIDYEGNTYSLTRWTGERRKAFDGALG